MRSGAQAAEALQLEAEMVIDRNADAEGTYGAVLLAENTEVRRARRRLETCVVLLC